MPHGDDYPGAAVAFLMIPSTTIRSPIRANMTNLHPRHLRIRISHRPWGMSEAYGLTLEESEALIPSTST